MIGDEQLQKIEERALRSTPGPHKVKRVSWRDGGVLLTVCRIPTMELNTNFPSRSKKGAQRNADFELLAHAREDILTLTAEVKRLTAALEQQRAGE